MLKAASQLLLSYIPPPVAPRLFLSAAAAPNIHPLSLHDALPISCEAFLSSLEQTVERCRRYHTPRRRPEEAAKMRQRLLAQYQDAMTAARTKPTRPAQS